MPDVDLVKTGAASEFGKVACDRVVDAGVLTLVNGDADQRRAEGLGDGERGLRRRRIAVALGIAQESLGLGKVGYVKMLGAPVANQAALAAIKAQTAEVYLEFEPDLAARLAGRNAPETRQAVLVGAGAIGSHLADCLARKGRFLWTVKSAEAFEVSTATVDVSSRDSVHALVETATPCSSIPLEVNMALSVRPGGVRVI